MYTGYVNPIYMTEGSSNYATHMDFYARSSDSVLVGSTIVYTAFFDSSGNAMSPAGYGSSSNYFYTEII